WLFFFSSRRRHTRFDCDWSSDVCSSDLLLEVRLDHVALIRIELNQKPLVHPIDVGIDVSTLVEPAPIVRGCADLFRGELLQEGQIGRASCRERVEITGVDVGLEKKEGYE